MAENGFVPPDAIDKDVVKLLNFLRQKGLKRAEAALLNEIKQAINASGQLDNDLPELDEELSTVESKANGDAYFNQYESFQEAVRSTVSERCKPEIGAFLFPLFALAYLKNILNGNGEVAKIFFAKFHKQHEPYWSEYIIHLGRVRSAEEVADSPIASVLLSKEMVLRVSRQAERELRRIVADHCSMAMLIKQYITVELTEEAAKSYEALESVKGSLLGEAPKALNKCKLFTGIFKDFSSLSANSLMHTNDTLENEEAASKISKKKKSKSKVSSGPKKQKADPNAPPWNRVPFPVMSESWRADRHSAMSEAAKKHKFLADSRPSVYFYTIRNADSAVCSLDVSDDSTLLTVGFSDSTIRTQKLTSELLKCLKPAAQLESLCAESDDLENEMWDQSSAQQFVRFVGHSGPVFGVSYNDDKDLLVSCSEDATARLWSVRLRCCLVTYRYDVVPMLDAQFGPFGGYFATGDLHGTACVWMVERHSPVRMLFKHFLAVNRVLFHPNSNYLATCSSDRTVRLWDLTNGHCVRLFTGHKNSVHSLAFSRDGRTLASGCSDGVVNLWDIGQGKLAQQFVNHKSTVCCLDFSRDSSAIVSGGLDEQVSMHYLHPSSNQGDSSVFVDSTQADGTTRKMSNTCSYRTKDTPVQLVHFNRRNLILGCGALSKKK